MSNERVGRYQLLEPIGLGPTGSVSRAKVFGVAGFERQFAIKRFHADLTSQVQISTALSAAARAYGGLEHPRIARMSEFGIAQGTTYTAVEFVSGLDALRLITEVRTSNTTLAAGGALALVSQAARAVGYAHGRGLTHLGLSPTNVVITPEGDVKITDFGVLSATLGTRPVEVPRLAARIAYLAPEQIANEATSAATDVFALGVLAYELVTGARAFEGANAAEVAKSVATKPPPEPSLPRPIVRVIQRCLARSPFERFPDARALADALDAALRVAPVPGTRKDIGAQVKLIVDRLADLHSGELSGILSLHMGTASVGGPVAQIASLGAASRESDMDLATMEFVRPDTPVAGPAPLLGPASRPTRKPGEPADAGEPDDAGETMPSLARMKSKPVVPTIPSMSKELKVPPHTVPGLAPPPIGVPMGVPAFPPPMSPGASTSMAPPSIPKPLVGAVPPPKFGQGPTRAVASEPPDRPSESPVSPLKMMDGLPTGSAAAVPIARATPVPRDPKKQLYGALRADTDQPGAARTDLVIETDPGDVDLPFEEPSGLLSIDDLPSLAQPSLSFEMEIVDPNLDIESAVGPADRPTNEMSPLLRDQLALQASLRSDNDMPQWRPSSLDEISAPNEMPEAPPMRGSALGSPPERKTLAGVQPSRSISTQPAFPPNPAVSDRDLPTHTVPKRSKGPMIIASVLGVMVLGAGGYVAYDAFLADNPSEGGPVAIAADAAAADTVSATPDATVIAIADAAEAVADAGKVATADAAKTAVDAAVVAVADAATVKPPADAAATEPTGSSDALTITSTPSGARVYLDGADSGVTPVKLPGTPDKHTIAILSAGHELYVAQIKGSGAYAIPLKEVTPPGGPAGIKVTKCAKDRYYVFVDGKATGMVCPTERIEVEVGNHTIEVYDVVTEARRQFPVVVKDTRLSVRVRVE